MRIWFDLSNSPHINLFAAMIRELESEGHEILITCRPLANTIDLLRLHALPHEVVGAHYGAQTLRKVWGYPVRVRQLYRYLSPLRPDVAISQSSFHSPLVARLLGIPSLYMNDNEHALGNVPAFVFASTIMIPEALSPDRVRRQGARRRKVVQYPGVKEGIYLWNRNSLTVNGAAPSTELAGQTIYIRPEPWAAQYYHGDVDFLDSVITELKRDYRIVVLPRDRAQCDHYRSSRFEGVCIPTEARSIDTIAQDCDLFIGAGGTMTRELAVLGTPTISVYQAELLAVDKYLLNEGCLVHEPTLDAAFVRAFLRRRTKEPPNQELLRKGERAFHLIKDTVVEVGAASRVQKSAGRAGHP